MNCETVDDAVSALQTSLLVRHKTSTSRHHPAEPAAVAQEPSTEASAGFATGMYAIEASSTPQPQPLPPPPPLTVATALLAWASGHRSSAKEELARLPSLLLSELNSSTGRSAEAATLLVVFGLTAVLLFLCCAAGSTSGGDSMERRRPDKAGMVSAGRASELRPLGAAPGAAPHGAGVSSRWLPPVGTTPRASAVASAPSPRSIARGPAAESMGRQLILSPPSQWQRFGGLYSICAERLPADIENAATGTFELGRVDGGGGGRGVRSSLVGSAGGGALAEVPLFASVVVGQSGLRELFLSPTPAMSPVLCCCSPSPTGCMASEGRLLEPCSQLDIKDKDGALWGSIVPTGGDSYMVVHNGQQALIVEGVQEAGRLLIFALPSRGSLPNLAEPVAHAARVVQNNVAMLEVGVKPHLDPILALTVILGVVIFNPEERCPTPLPSVGDMWRSFSAPQHSIMPSDPRPSVR